jgi:hypothetical protein
MDHSLTQKSLIGTVLVLARGRDFPYGVTGKVDTRSEGQSDRSSDKVSIDASSPYEAYQEPVQ